MINKNYIMHCVKYLKNLAKNENIIVCDKEDEKE